MNLSLLVGQAQQLERALLVEQALKLWPISLPERMAKLSVFLLALLLVLRLQIALPLNEMLSKR